MNRGQVSDLTFLNVPTPIGNGPSDFRVFARPDPATLAPLFTPQVPIVQMQPHMPPFIQPPMVPYSAQPRPLGPAPTISLVTLAVILVLWVARMLFRK
jgi:hypothetical protein